MCIMVTSKMRQVLHPVNYSNHILFDQLVLYVKSFVWFAIGKAKSKILQTGALLLSSCWRHYSILIFLEDYQFSQHYEEWLNQYLSGIQVKYSKSSFDDLHQDTYKVLILGSAVSCWKIGFPVYE